LVAKRIIINVLLCAAILLVALAAVNVLLAKHTDAFLFGVKPCIITSESMEPHYLRNSLVVITKTDYDDVIVGDVIAYRSEMMGGRIAFHRVIQQNADGYITKGDAVKFPDSVPVTEEMYVGRELWHTNAPAEVITALGSPKGLLAFVIMPLLGIAFIVVLIKYLKPDKRPRVKENAEIHCPEK